MAYNRTNVVQPPVHQNLSHLGLEGRDVMLLMESNACFVETLDKCGFPGGWFGYIHLQPTLSKCRHCYRSAQLIITITFPSIKVPYQTHISPGCTSKIHPTRSQVALKGFSE